MDEEKALLALKELLYKMADDLLILGHRNSEWTGIGPLLEEDIAFSSMAQDKVGQSWTYYKLLNELGEADPDTVAFTRNAEQFHNSQFVELPNGEYDFSLMRHYLFDQADFLRLQALTESPVEEVALVAKKLRGEVKYHLMHGTTWVQQLGQGTEESKARMQQALETALPYALGIFEPSPMEDVLVESGIFVGEEALKTQWMQEVEKVITAAGLNMPSWDSLQPVYGGRTGQHTEHLQPLLDEMTEVFSVDPTADW